MASLPYLPTWTFSYKTFVYIFKPVLSNQGSYQFVSLDTTQDVDVANLEVDTLSSVLPFPNDGQGVAVTPAMANDGNITVLSGDCRKGPSASTLWRFTPSPKSLNGNGSWAELPLAPANQGQQSLLDGANYLAAAASFSSTANTAAGLFAFGGMCPNNTKSDPTDWTTNAAYSNNMLVLEPVGSASNKALSYSLGESPSRGAPIPEAGFTMTPLIPAYSNSTGVDQSQNRNFVLLGGHTQQAFINMSQIALFSLPEQTWTYIPIDQPSPTPNTDLARRSGASIDPRSGHSAVLTPDGKSIVVFGGWVGDVSNPADPQLAVLKLGSGFGGSGDWQWSRPAMSGTGLASGTGLYGHGATMIASDIMLITGGYLIPANSGKMHRRAGTSPSTTNFLLNTTSNTFIPNYSPSQAAKKAFSNANAKSTSSSAQKAGLRVGLTIGILAILIAVFVYFWYSRRLKKRREAREEELRRLAAGAHRFHLTAPRHPTSTRQPEMTTVWAGQGGHQREDESYPWNAQNTSSHNRTNSGATEAERTGLLFEIPSPTRGLRRSLHSRATYQPSRGFEDGRRGAGAGGIHPIDERDEYDDEAGGNDTLQHQDYNLLSNVPVLDPFRDPSENSRTPSPQSPADRQAEVRGWIDDWTAATAILHHGGRLSPERTDRTSSTLSEQSARSLLSHSSMQQTVGTVSRNASQRSAAVLGGAGILRTNLTGLVTSSAAAGDDSSPQESRSKSPVSPLRSGSHHQHRRSRSLGLTPTSILLPFPTTTTTTTAQGNNPPTIYPHGESFPRLRFESEALLGEYTPNSANSSEPNSPTKLQRAKGWMGSVRRALTGAADGSHSRGTSTSPILRNTSTTSSPTKRYHYRDDSDDNHTLTPRRAASTGGGVMLWAKSRQGAKDWDTSMSEGGGLERTRSSNNRDDAHTTHSSSEDADWDVESAVEKRVVQVMFTVPKEKLRVVNQGPEEVDGDGESVKSGHRGGGDVVSGEETRGNGGHDIATVSTGEPGADPTCPTATTGAAVDVKGKSKEKEPGKE